MPEPFTVVRSRVVPLPVDNVDTDQIIPARFLKGVDRAGLADGLFADWRSRPGFPLDRPEYRDARILLAGENFGCGSSREHAAWALAEHGFRVVVSGRFADIFRNNALKNALLPVTLPSGTCRALMARAAGPGGLELEVDLATERVRAGDQESWPFAVDPFARRCLLEGVDQLGYLLAKLPAIGAWEARLPAPVETRRLTEPEAEGGAP
jgi:3-isopropylmalate/(R)-2-methylmalate dehydratase small subunit